MRLLTQQTDVAPAIDALRSALDASGLPHYEVHWSFPGNGSTRFPLKTWHNTDPMEPIAVAVGERLQWKGRTPVIVALEAVRERMCSNVEVNIPDGSRPLNRNVNGVFGREPDGRLWLLHRGVRLTAHGGTIRKREIHDRFRSLSRLVVADDDDRQTEVIPVALVEAGEIIRGLREFAGIVLALKAGRDDAGDK